MDAFRERSPVMAHTLLIVEDNAVVREGLGVILRRNGDEVITVPNGRDALERLAAGPRPDVILMDMLMPVLDGWRLIKLLKSSQHAEIPIIIITGTIVTRDWAAMHDCAGFVKKPVEEQELLDEIRRVLGAKVGVPGQEAAASS
jgi:CheY-like chemotaxis protein